MADPSRPVTGYPPYSSNGYPPPSHPNSQPYFYSGPPPPPPPPPPPLYPYNNPNPYFYRPPLSPRSFLRSLIAGMVVFFVIIAVILFIVWLVLRPHLPDFRIDSLQVSNFSLASQSLSAIWVVGFSVYNPNKKMTLSYDDVEPSLYYKSEFLSLTRIPPFTQGKRNQTTLTASFSLSNSYVDPWVVNGINGDRARGAVNFNVKIQARTGFRAGGWRTRRRFLRVLCQDVAVGLSSSNSSGSGKLVGESRECRVGM